MEDFSKRREDIVERYRGGGMGLDCLNAELQESILDLKAATGSSSKAVFMAPSTLDEEHSSIQARLTASTSWEGEVGVRLTVTMEKGNSA